jgi:2-phosphoglycolate phosphatase
MRAILLDLDGTLIDSVPDLASAANAARATLALAPLTVPEVERHVGWGLTHLLTGVLPGGPTEATRAAFIAHYHAHVLDQTAPYPGVDAWLRHTAHPLGLVTNKPRRFVEPILDGLGWTERFGVVVAGDDPVGRKPDPAPLHHAARALGFEVSEGLFVGDSEVDAAAAQAAGMPFAAVAWGRVARQSARVLGALAELG